MPSIRLTAEEMRYITLFESLTGAVTRDCIIDAKLNRLIFIVKPGDMGLAIGKRGVNVKRLQKMLGKAIEVVEYAESPEDLIKNSLSPARVRAVKISKSPNGRKIAYVTIEPQDKGIAIGREGKNIARARMIAKRYFDIDHVVIV
ncbi:MAG: NusA-like transcription termination signal-binding factor [archaeon GB-1867-005]|nr:NusA-like transcription termination signal-binding factor [Candidatus Culexmicrobium cathedralense]